MPPSNHKVYLTFDDGPRWGTDDVIAVLRNKQVRGTLLMTGNHTNTGSMKKILNDAKSSPFVEIGNHSSTHASYGNRLNYSRYYANPAGVLAGFQKANKTLGLTGDPYVPARLPGRNTWSVRHVVGGPGDSGAAANLLARSGFRIYGWDIEWHKAKNGAPLGTPEQLLERAKNMLLYGATKSPREIVILTHDTMFKASSGGRQKLERFIDLLKADGFRMDFLSHYLDPRYFE